MCHSFSKQCKIFRLHKNSSNWYFLSTFENIQMRIYTSVKGGRGEWGWAHRKARRGGGQWEKKQGWLVQDQEETERCIVSYKLFVLLPCIKLKGTDTIDTLFSAKSWTAIIAGTWVLEIHAVIFAEATSNHSECHTPSSQQSIHWRRPQLKSLSWWLTSRRQFFSIPIHEI